MHITTTYCDVYLIRHGETAWNKERILQGHYDEPLNANGIEQAKQLGKELASIDFSAAFSSDLSRASQTAAEVFRERKITVQKTPALRERTLQEWEKKKRADLEAKVVSEKIGLHLGLPREEFLTFKLFGRIEGYGEIYKRLNMFLQAQVSSYLGKTILLSSHGGVLHSVLYTLAYKSDQMWRVPNCSYLRLRAFEDGKIELIDMKGPSLTADPVSMW